MKPVTWQEKQNSVKKNWQWRHIGELWRCCHFFQFMANLELSGSRIQDAESIKLTFSLKVAFHLQKRKTELKILKYSSHTIALSKGIIFAKKRWFFAKNADISKIKKALVLKRIFSETKYVGVLTYQISGL